MTPRSTSPGRRSRKPGSKSALGWLLLAAAALGTAMFYACKSSIGSPKLARKLDARYIIIDLSAYRVEPVLAKGPGSAEPFAAIVSRTGCYAAISGTFHDPNNRPIGDLLSDGKLIARGYQRQGVGFRVDGRMVFLERRPGEKIDWRGCVSGIACGPRLVRDGRKAIDLRRDGFGAAASAVTARRSAIGSDGKGRLILCVVLKEITLDALADLMVELGAVDAVNLDGGSMCALYVNGVFHAEPALNVSNVLCVFQGK